MEIQAVGHSEDPNNTGSAVWKFDENQPDSLASFMAKTFNESSWLVEGVFPQGVNMIGSSEYEGKTRMIFDLAFDLALGKPWLNKFQTLKSPGIIYLLDNKNFRNLQDRFKEAVVGKNLTVPEMDSLGHQITLIDRAIDLSCDQEIIFLAKDVERYRPKWIVIDTFSSAFFKDQNEELPVKQTLNDLRNFAKKYDITFLISDHFNKYKTYGPLKDRLNGSGAKKNNVDGLLCFQQIKGARISRNGEVQKLLKVEHSKYKIGATIDPFPPILMKGKEGMSCSFEIVTTPTFTKGGKPQGRNADIIRFLNSVFCGHEDEDTAISTLDLINAGREQGISEKRIRQAVKALYGSGFLGSKKSMRLSGEEGGRKPGYWRKGEFDSDGLSCG